METPDRKTILSYLYGQLNTEQSERIDSLLNNDSEFKKVVIAELLIEMATKPSPFHKARLIFDKLKDDLLPKSVQEEQQLYSIQELLDVFKPQLHLESEAIRRSANQETQNPLEKLVLLPLDKVNVVTGSIWFVFENPISYPMQLYILNNKEVELKKITIPAETDSYEIYLDELKSGQYYWQLRLIGDDRELNRTYGIATGSFFVNEQLSPPELK